MQYFFKISFIEIMLRLKLKMNTFYYIIVTIKLKKKMVINKNLKKLCLNFSIAILFSIFIAYLLSSFTNAD